MRLGEHDITKDRDCPVLSNFGCNNEGVQDYDIEKFIIHKEYNSPNVFQNDIAIIKLKNKVIKYGKWTVKSSDKLENYNLLYK